MMAIISGTSGPDNLRGTNENDLIEGLSGDDVIDGGAGRDKLYGGDGNDRLDGTGGTFSGFVIDSVLSGGAGDDLLQPIGFDSSGSHLDPPITLVDGGSGVDTVRIETDLAWTIDLSDPSTPRTFFGGELFVGHPPNQPFVGMTLVNVERLQFRASTGNLGNDITGGALDDEITGGRNNDTLRGGGGDDILSGGDSGRDTLLGGNGDDHLSMGLGDILIDGGDGIDSIFFAGYYPASETMIFSLADPSVEQTLLGATVRNVESIGGDSYGTRGDDVVTGGDYDDVFEGWTGNDIIRGGGGDDRLDGELRGPGFGYGEIYGYAGDDEIHGDAGSDVITGGPRDDLLYGGDDGDRLSGDEGNDILNGGEGADDLSGGTGADVFVFAPGDLGFSYATRDKIDDLEVGVDQLDLSAFTDAAITLSNDGAYARVKFDFDGDHKTDALIQVATLSGALLTMEDLLL